METSDPPPTPCATQPSQSALEPKQRGITAERVLQKGALSEALGGLDRRRWRSPMPEAKNTYLEQQRKLAGWPAS